MYERFTDRARNTMQLANREAQRYQHEYVGTEHILLGLIAEGSGVAANVLKNLGVDLAKIRREIEKVVQKGPHPVKADRLPQTPRTKKVVEYSIEEARNLGHNYVGTEHLLLGVLREREGVASMILINLGLKLDRVRQEILHLLEGDPGFAPRPAAAPSAPALLEAESPPDLAPDLGELDKKLDQLGQEKEEAVAEQDFERAARLRDQGDKLKKQRDALWIDWRTRHPLDPAWLEWNGGTILRAATLMAEHRAWGMLPILGELLHTAGCRDAVLLDHCREPGRHRDHCWLIDLLLAED